MTVDSFLVRLQGVRRTSSGWHALCPAHPDHQPSLSVAVGSDQRILLKCHAGCTAESIVKALGLTMKDLFAAPSVGQGRIVATYDYRDAKGNLKYQNVRYEPKAFKVRKPDGSGGWLWSLKKVKRLPYRLPDLKGREHIYITEGEKDANRLWDAGIPATCSTGGAESWSEDISKQLAEVGVTSATVFPDCDEAGMKYARQVFACNTAAGIVTKIAQLPGNSKGFDVSDYLDAHTTDELLALEEHALNEPPPVEWDAAPDRPQVTPCTIAQANATFRKWLGPKYDLTAMHAAAAAAAIERMDGDPLWLMILSGPGFAKTETVQAAAGAGAVIVSTISSDGALLSGTSKKERTKDATGGLLAEMGPRGILVIKDFTSILSMNHVVRASVLAALREVYDGYWARRVGADGGKTLAWSGRIVVVAAVTSAWDQHHSVISALGDRFALLRIDSNLGREEAGTQAMANISHETQMRQELAEAFGGLVANINPSVTLTDAEREALLKAADLTTRCRTAVEFDYRGNVLEAHMPEAPTRFAKELAQLMRGAIAIGLPREDAMKLAIRCARDSMPPMRLLILGWLAANNVAGGMTHPEIWRGLDLPRTSVRRHLDALHQLKLVTLREDVVLVEAEGDKPATTKSEFRYSLANDVDPRVVGWEVPVPEF